MIYLSGTVLSSASVSPILVGGDMTNGTISVATGSITTTSAVNRISIVGALYGCAILISGATISSNGGGIVVNTLVTSYNSLYSSIAISSSTSFVTSSSSLGLLSIGTSAAFTTLQMGTTTAASTTISVIGSTITTSAGSFIHFGGTASSTVIVITGSTSVAASYNIRFTSTATTVSISLVATSTFSATLGCIYLQAAASAIGLTVLSSTLTSAGYGVSMFGPLTGSNVITTTTASISAIIKHKDIFQLGVRQVDKLYLLFLRDKTCTIQDDIFSASLAAPVSYMYVALPTFGGKKRDIRKMRDEEELAAQEAAALVVFVSSARILDAEEGACRSAAVAYTCFFSFLF